MMRALSPSFSFNFQQHLFQYGNSSHDYMLGVLLFQYINVYGQLEFHAVVIAFRFLYRRVENTFDFRLSLGLSFLTRVAGMGGGAAVVVVVQQKQLLFSSPTMMSIITVLLLLLLLVLELVFVFCCDCD